MSDKFDKFTEHARKVFALAQEEALGAPVFRSADAKEGPTAFFEKRKPVFTGK